MIIAVVFVGSIAYVISNVKLFADVVTLYDVPSRVN